MLKGSRGFYHAQSVKAIALEVGGEQVVLLKSPMMSSETSITYGTLRRLREMYGLDLAGRLLMGATHSHHTTARYWRLPAVMGLIGTDEIDEEVLERICTTFAEVVMAALDDLAPAQWGYAFQEDWDPDDDVFTDRREENDERWGKDGRLGLLAVRRPEGTPMATIINFGMHGTLGDSSNDLFSEDAAGGLEITFEDYFFAREGAPIVGMFIQSGGADARPAGNYRGHRNPLQRAEMLGHAAAPRVHALYRGIAWQDEAALAVRSRLVDLRYDWMGYDENDEFQGPGGVPYTWGGLQCGGEVVEGETLEGKPKQCTDVAWLLNMFGLEVPFEPIHQTYLTTVRLGSLFLVSLPAEPTASLIEYLRAQIAARASADLPLDVMAFGYSQDYLLYLTSYEDWFYGGFETGGTLWGPLGGNYLVDRQMELIDDLLGGFARPVFYEELPRLSEEPHAFEPRPFEASVDPGEVTLPVAEGYGRGETLHFGWAGGDPAILSPRVVLEAEQGGGGFVPVPSPSGWPGQAYDNSRGYMVTVYDPDPPADAAIRDERLHQWTIAWQVPAEFPAGTYRLAAAGPWWDGDSVEGYVAHSAPFAVTHAASATLDATLEAGVLALQLTMAPVAPIDDGHVVREGWRVLDPRVGPDDAISLRAPLRLRFALDGALQEGAWEATWDDAAAAYLFDFAGTGLDAGAGVLAVHAALAADLVPAELTADVTRGTRH